jgi:hypothetical protein
MPRSDAIFGAADQADIDFRARTVGTSADRNPSPAVTAVMMIMGLGVPSASDP